MLLLARGTGIVAAPAAKRLLQMAGVQDCYTQSKGSTATQGNFLKATLAAIAKTYEFLSPDLWKIIPPGQTPYVASAPFATFQTANLTVHQLRRVLRSPPDGCQEERLLNVFSCMRIVCVRLSSIFACSRL